MLYLGLHCLSKFHFQTEWQALSSTASTPGVSISAMEPPSTKWPGPQLPFLPASTSGQGIVLSTSSSVSLRATPNFLCRYPEPASIASRVGIGNTFPIMYLTAAQAIPQRASHHSGPQYRSFSHCWDPFQYDSAFANCFFLGAFSILLFWLTLIHPPVFRTAIYFPRRAPVTPFSLDGSSVISRLLTTLSPYAVIVHICPSHYWHQLSPLACIGLGTMGKTWQGSKEALKSIPDLSTPFPDIPSGRNEGLDHPVCLFLFSF